MAKSGAPLKRSLKSSSRWEAPSSTPPATHHPGPLQKPGRSKGRESKLAKTILLKWFLRNLPHQTDCSRRGRLHFCLTKAWVTPSRIETRVRSFSSRKMWLYLNSCKPLGGLLWSFSCLSFLPPADPHCMLQTGRACRPVIANN